MVILTSLVWFTGINNFRRMRIQCMAVVCKFRISAKPEPIGMIIEWLNVCGCHLHYIFSRYLHSWFSLHPKQQVYQWKILPLYPCAQRITDGMYFQVTNNKMFPNKTLVEIWVGKMAWWVHKGKLICRTHQMYISKFKWTIYRGSTCS